MVKKLSSVALVGFLALSLTACGTTTPPAEDKANVGINVNVEDKGMMKKPATDKENVGINIEVKDSTMTK